MKIEDNQAVTSSEKPYKICHNLFEFPEHDNRKEKLEKSMRYSIFRLRARKSMQEISSSQLCFIRDIMRWKGGDH